MFRWVKADETNESWMLVADEDASKALAKVWRGTDGMWYYSVIGTQKIDYNIARTTAMQKAQETFYKVVA